MKKLGLNTTLLLLILMSISLGIRLGIKFQDKLLPSSELSMSGWIACILYIIIFWIYINKIWK